MARLITTLGPKSADELGAILPHEHVFVDLRTWDQPGYAEAETAEVVALMAPEIERARAAGITAIVECSTVGVGRRADIDRAVSDATGLKFDLTDVDGAAQASLAQISAQLEDNDEVAEVVRALEAQYDAFTRAAEASLLTGEGPLPTGEELGAEFERFLAGLDRPDDRP